MWRRVWPRSLSSMFEISPVWNFLMNLVSCGLVSLNGAQRWTESGRKPEREGSSGQLMSLAMRTATRRRTSAYSSYEPPWMSRSYWWKRGMISSRSSMVKPSRDASRRNASNTPLSQSISVPYTSKVTKETLEGRAMGRALCHLTGRRGSATAHGDGGFIESPPFMDLLEYQGKQLFARHDIPVPDGRHARTVEEAVTAAKEIGFPCAIKAQVKIGGRGKAGGIKIANDEGEAREHAGAILGMDIKGFTVHEVWIEGASQIEAEYYASIVFDRGAKAPLIMLSTQGGMDIEEVAETNPDAIATLHVDPLLGFQDFHGRRLAFEAGVDADLVRPIGAFLHRLYGTFVAEEAMLVEVNPLIVTPERGVAALDAKVTLDDNALFRHPDNAQLRDPSDEDPQEQMAKERGLTFVKLDGDIGILGNGAGLVMSTLDVVAQYGGEPANFLDAGGGSKAEAITSAVEVILSNEKVKAVLFNIFGGITRCDEVANGLVEAFNQIKPTVPFVVRLDGTNDVEGRKILAEASLPNVHTAATMNEAAEKVVELAA